MVPHPTLQCSFLEQTGMGPGEHTLCACSSLARERALGNYKTQPTHPPSSQRGSLASLSDTQIASPPDPPWPEVLQRLLLLLLFPLLLPSSPKLAVFVVRSSFLVFYLACVPLGSSAKLALALLTQINLLQRPFPCLLLYTHSKQQHKESGTLSSIS